MTVVEAIVKWLKEARINKISTDSLPGQSVAYGIAKAPTQNVKTFVSGRRIYTDYYDFLARLDSKTDAERVNNHNSWRNCLSGYMSRMYRSCTRSFRNILSAVIYR